MSTIQQIAVCEVCGDPVDPRPRFQGRWCQPCGDEPLNDWTDTPDEFVMFAGSSLEPGMRFEKLTLLKRATDYEQLHLGTFVARWVCRCDCGNETVVREDFLKNSHTRSCGCLMKVTSAWRFEDRVGRRYNRLTVIERVLNRRGKVYWKCRCDCGRFTTVSTNNLVFGGVKSCGCLQGDARSSRLLDLTGLKVGRWTVVGLADRNGGKPKWLCRCECGTEREVLGSSLRSGQSQSCGCLKREVAEARMKREGQNLARKRWGQEEGRLREQ